MRDRNLVDAELRAVIDELRQMYSSAGVILFRRMLYLLIEQVASDMLTAPVERLESLQVIAKQLKAMNDSLNAAPGAKFSPPPLYRF